MDLKDYYSILELPPSASVDEVKRAYRRLAQVYHPDKSGNDPYARAQFTAIKEAYETLTNPQRKEEYLQTRWYAKSQGHMATVAPITPVSFLQRLILKERAVYQIDAHRSDYLSLVKNLEEFYSDETIETLLGFGDKTTLDEIVACSIRMAAVIPHPWVQPLLQRIARLDTDNRFQKQISSLSAKSKRTASIEKYMPLVVALITLLILLMIFLA